MSSKVAKLVFDTDVAPRWAETSDRFWYAFETAQGRKFYLVDPSRRTKTPLWSCAKMAAMLTNTTRIPYDLWVINSLATPRPKLEPYRYTMLGEENVDQDV